jgi:hypothetical protein
MQEKTDNFLQKNLYLSLFFFFVAATLILSIKRKKKKERYA